MKITALGTSHGATEKGRFCSASLISVGESNYLLDCGAPVEGLMTNLDIPVTSIKSVFITHMHEDHIGTLSSVAKRFIVYDKEKSCDFYLPEQNGIDAFVSWCDAVHMAPGEKIRFHLVNEGIVYSDENITVTAIPTKHLVRPSMNFPSYSYMIEAQGKRVLFTGDLAGDFSDFPKITEEKEFDAIISEITHFTIESALPILQKAKTKRLIFSHVSTYNLKKLGSLENLFPYPVTVASDLDVFEI